MHKLLQNVFSFPCFSELYPEDAERRKYGKMERSHRENQKRFYSCRSFSSLNDFEKQLAIHERRANNFPISPLGWLSPSQFTVQYG